MLSETARDTKGSKLFEDIREDVYRFTRSKEVQQMILAEDLAIMDWNSQKRWEKEEGRKSLIEDMLRRGKTVEEIVDFCGCSIEFVKEVEDRINKIH